MKADFTLATWSGKILQAHGLYFGSTPYAPTEIDLVLVARDDSKFAGIIMNLPTAEAVYAQLGEMIERAKDKRGPLQ